MRSARASPSTSRRPRPKRVPLRLISPKRVVRAACEPALRQDRGEPKGLVDDSPARRGRPVRDAWEVKPCFSKGVFDNSVRVASRLSVRRIIAWRIHASEVSASLSQSLLILRYLPSRASVRSTAHRLARILNPRSPFGRFTISSAQPVASFTHSAASPLSPRPPISDQASETARPASLPPTSPRPDPGRSQDEPPPQASTPACPR